jgi:hypothetical protein
VLFLIVRGENLWIMGGRHLCRQIKRASWVEYLRNRMFLNAARAQYTLFTMNKISVIPLIVVNLRRTCVSHIQVMFSKGNSVPVAYVGNETILFYTDKS